MLAAADFRGKFSSPYLQKADLFLHGSYMGLHFAVQATSRRDNFRLSFAPVAPLLFSVSIKYYLLTIPIVTHPVSRIKIT